MPSFVFLKSRKLYNELISWQLHFWKNEASVNLPMSKCLFCIQVNGNLIIRERKSGQTEAKVEVYQLSVQTNLRFTLNFNFLPRFTSGVFSVSAIRLNWYIRIGGLYFLPALVDFLTEFVERAEAELPLQLGGVSLFGWQNLTQGVDLLLHLEHNQHTTQSEVYGLTFHSRSTQLFSFSSFLKSGFIFTSDVETHFLSWTVLPNSNPLYSESCWQTSPKAWQKKHFSSLLLSPYFDS